MTALTALEKQKLSLLFDRAVHGLMNSDVGKVGNAGKAFEIYALAVTLRLLRKKKFILAIANAPKGVMSLPGGPCKPDPAKHTYFNATKTGSAALQVWVSVETCTLSSSLKKSALGSLGSLDYCEYHEVDVGVFFAPLVQGLRPEFSQLAFAASCKYRKASKEHVREALGLRRETGYLSSPNLSLAPWFVPHVSTNPAAPVVLFSRDAAIESYARPVDMLGLYVRHLKYLP